MHFSRHVNVSLPQHDQSELMMCKLINQNNDFRRVKLEKLRILFFQDVNVYNNYRKKKNNDNNNNNKIELLGSDISAYCGDGLCSI